MHRRCKSWRKSIHAHKGNSLWARIDNFRKNLVIVRAHLRVRFLTVFIDLLLPLFVRFVQKWEQKYKEMLQFALFLPLDKRPCI